MKIKGYKLYYEGIVPGTPDVTYPIYVAEKPDIDELVKYTEDMYDSDLYETTEDIDAAYVFAEEEMEEYSKYAPLDQYQYKEIFESEEAE
ncbi:hypothetical protein [Enterococcus pallens]|uniref:Uncharacterized protein n=1 Tax=Enterococcus pallens ATCC BAA-351 TaxID=1158607 RepID=R2T7Z6_9ENTE|nr:hypothetical protein [Enterococcus pallens]EOH96364.1 hypothetical protein UAU_01014 [Enterococcus pallens ATCC BAA-351]EOU14423.1 hypothetical protein I588_04780 [Enterococcus pallens ATCC BAA-351]OJG69430.1 hypothetical protein RV10_GL000900 [Enterococcus pallens]